MKTLDKFITRDFSNPGKSNVISSNFMAVSSHHIASSVGIEILKNGGNAVDAALAMSAVLCVAEPHMTGIGGDCFAMLSIDGSANIKALNASGKSSENSSAKHLRNKGIKLIKPECLMQSQYQVLLQDGVCFIKNMVIYLGMKYSSLL